MRLKVNGKEVDLQVTNLFEVVAAYNLNNGLVVTEVDGNIVDREDWGKTNVTDGMTIEIVHFVGGG
jgi:sulfur carrier protein